MILENIQNGHITVQIIIDVSMFSKCCHEVPMQTSGPSTNKQKTRIWYLKLHKRFYSKQVNKLIPEEL